MIFLADRPVSDSAGSDAATWCPYSFSIHLRAQVPDETHRCLKLKATPVLLPINEDHRHKWASSNAAL